MNQKGLQKIHIDLPNHWKVDGESFWATSLGNDLYRLENVPFYAYGLNYHDVVRAIPNFDKTKPGIREVIEVSGHRTFRIFFSSHVSEEKQFEILDALKPLTISYQGQTLLYFSLDIQPDGDYLAIYNILKEYVNNGVIAWFETCEARVEGSFDDIPEKDK